MQLRTGPGVLLFGPAGIGKSSVLDALVADARPQGVRVLRCTPVEPESRLPFAGLIDLLADVPEEMFTRLPDGLGEPLRSAVLRGDLPDSDQEHLRVRMAVLHLLRLLSARAPVWLVVDDAQWLDRPTGEVLAFVARRASGPSPRILAAERSACGGASPAASTFGAADGITLARVEVPPPTPDELGRLIARHCDLGLSAATVRLIHQTCAGNPGHAVELARALPPGPWPDAPREPLPVPARLRETLLRRTRELPERARALLLAASAARRPTLALLAEACADERAGAHLAAAELLGVVRVDPAGLVEFEHPLVRAAVYADASADERSAAHAGLAAAATETAERARHLALADPRRTEPLARHLAEAATAAGRRGAPRLAAELAGLAAQRTPGAAAHAHAERSLAAARHAWDAGLRADARRFADQVLAGGSSVAQRTAARIILLRCAGQSLGSAGPLIAHGLAESTGLPALQARLWSWSAAAELTAGNAGDSVRHARKAAYCARRAGDVTAEIEALSKLAHVHALTGDAEGEPVLRRALDLVEREVARGAAPRTDFWEPLRRQALFDLQAGRLAEAEQRLAALAGQLGETFDHEGLCTVLVTLTDVRVRAGSCRTALDSARWALRVAQELGGTPAPVLFAAALAESAGGTTAEAVRLAEAGVRTARADGDVHGLLRSLGALGGALLQSGAAEQAVQALREAELIESRVGIVDPASGNWHADYVEALLATGREQQADAVLARVGEQARELGRHRVQTALGRGRALRTAMLGRPAEAAADLRRVAAAQAQQPIERVKTLMSLAATDSRRGRPDQARTALAEARRVAVIAGAAPWIARIDAQRGRGGVRLASPLPDSSPGLPSASIPGSAPISGSSPYAGPSEFFDSDVLPGFGSDPCSDSFSGPAVFSDSRPEVSGSDQTSGFDTFSGPGRGPDSYSAELPVSSRIPNPAPDRGPDIEPAIELGFELELGLTLGSRPGPALRPDQELTRAEDRCARLAARGATNREIAEALHLSVKTVEGTLSRSYRKLGVRSRTQLARLIGPGGPGPAASKGTSVPEFG